MRAVINPAAIDGGLIGSCVGHGVADMGGFEYASGQVPSEWVREMRVLMRRYEGRESWLSVWLSDLLPSRFVGLFGVYDENGLLTNGVGQSPRSMWRSEELERTEMSRCVGCLARELEERLAERRSMEVYCRESVEGVARGRSRLSSSRRSLIFRRHSCMYGLQREVVRHGLIPSSLRDVEGGGFGWLADFRVYVSAHVPTRHPETYIHGVIRIGVQFHLPIVFNVMLGNSVFMRGHLFWDGYRISRGQPTTLTWFPLEGDGAGLTGPVRRVRWTFESDFTFSDRPDAFVTALSIQLTNIRGNDGSVEENSESRRGGREARSERVSDMGRRNIRSEWYELNGGGEGDVGGRGEEESRFDRISSILPNATSIDEMFPLSDSGVVAGVGEGIEGPEPEAPEVLDNRDTTTSTNSP